MTQETRETLEQMHAYATARAEWHPSLMDLTDPRWDEDDLAEYVEESARWGRRALALRDVLTPRTCAGCKSRHEITGACYKDVQDPEGEEVTNTRSPWNWRNRDTFGCSEWKPRQAREGEGGEG